MNGYLVNRRAKVVHHAYGPGSAVPEGCNTDDMTDFYLTDEEIRSALKALGYRECERCFPPEEETPDVP